MPRPEYKTKYQRWTERGVEPSDPELYNFENDQELDRLYDCTEPRKTGIIDKIKSFVKSPKRKTPGKKSRSKEPPQWWVQMRKDKLNRVHPDGCKESGMAGHDTNDKDYDFSYMSTTGQNPTERPKYDPYKPKPDKKTVPQSHISRIDGLGFKSTTATKKNSKRDRHSDKILTDLQIPQKYNHSFSYTEKAESEKGRQARIAAMFCVEKSRTQSDIAGRSVTDIPAKSSTSTQSYPYNNKTRPKKSDDRVPKDFDNLIEKLKFDNARCKRDQNGKVIERIDQMNDSLDELMAKKKQKRRY